MERLSARPEGCEHRADVLGGHAGQFVRAVVAYDAGQKSVLSGGKLATSDSVPKGRGQCVRGDLRPNRQALRQAVLILSHDVGRASRIGFLIHLRTLT